MVHSSDVVSASRFLSAEFPPDHAAAPSWLTVPFSLLYRSGAALHGGWRAARAQRADLPVISVGNLTVGGTGKTPCVIALATLLAALRPELAKPRAIAVLTRGYGRRSQGRVIVEDGADWRNTGDEPLLIKTRLPHATVIVDADRVAAARAATALGCRIILLDDGFQYRQLARDLDIVLVDGIRPVGNGWLLPAGPLREPPTALRRAHLLVGAGNEDDPARALAAQAGLRYSNARVETNLPASLQVAGTRVFAFCGIARPSRFLDSLKNNGLTVVGQRIFPDHHPFSVEELSQLGGMATKLGATSVVTTEKDRIRISHWDAQLPLETLRIDMKFADLSLWRGLLDPLVGRAVE